MRVQRQIDKLLAQRAAEWMETLKKGDKRDQAQFSEWLRQSKLHVEHYLELAAIDRELQALDPAQCPNVDTLLSEISPKVIHLDRGTQPVRWRPLKTPARFWRVSTAVAASVAVLGFAVLQGYLGFLRSADKVTTTAGEQRALTLDDGSIVTLNTRTTLRIDFSAQQRDVQMDSGEAAFKVAHDPLRPFVVQTPLASVRAVGTQFNVYQRPDDLLVSVVEGRVQIATLSSATHVATDTPAIEYLDAGEEALVRPNGTIEKRAHPDVQRALAWRQRRLSFDETPLEEIVREFNRYNSSTNLRLERIPPGSRRYGGVFDADDPESLAALLERDGDLKVERREKEIVISGQ